MEIHVQQCQFCGSDSLKNILLREAGEADKVYVQCQQCEHFVASYVLAPLGYYHHGKGYESFLRSIHRSGDFMSGRNISRLYEERKEGELAQFERALQHLKRKAERRKQSEE